MGRRSRWILAWSSAIILLAGCSSAPNPTPPATTPLADVSAIPAAIEATVTGSRFAGLKDLRAIIVSVDGEVVAEKYYNSSAQDYADLQSVTKSVISTLVGIAIAEGKIDSVDAEVSELLPQYRDGMDRASARTTLRQLLTMTAGWSIDDSPFDRHLVRSWLRNGPTYKPGSRFEYSNIGPHIIAEILARATGMSVLDYARAKLFDPLDIPTRPAYEPWLEAVDYWHDDAFRAAGFAWVRAPNGIHAGPFGIKLRASDLLKIGQLYLDAGRWEGRQVVPAGWVRAATAADSPNGYGYLWWVEPVGNQRAFAAIGSGGQVIMVVPERRLVVAATSQLNDVADLGGRPIYQLVEAAVLPNVT